jgi:hypothetical protein
MQRTKVAILGAGLSRTIHMESYHRFVPEAEVVAVYAERSIKQKHLVRNIRFQNGTMILIRPSMIQMRGGGYMFAQLFTCCGHIKSCPRQANISLLKNLLRNMEEADAMIAAAKRPG